MGGCASMTALEEENLAEVQAFADATVRAFNIRPVQIAVGEGSVAFGDAPVVQVGRTLLTAPLHERDLRVARLLSFRVAKPPIPQSRPDEERINQALYPEANIITVGILTTVKQLPEPIAVQGVFTLLTIQVNAAAEKRLQLPPGAPHPCEQLRAFVGHFSRHDIEVPASCR